MLHWVVTMQWHVPYHFDIASIYLFKAYDREPSPLNSPTNKLHNNIGKYWIAFANGSLEPAD